MSSASPRGRNCSRPPNCPHGREKRSQTRFSGTVAELDFRSARPAPAAREGPRRRPLLRAARRRRPGPRRRPLARALQPRVPPRVRRVAARVPADPPARAGGRAAAHHRPLGRRHLLLGRAAERRLVHDELHAAPTASRRPPTARRSRRPPQHALVPACVVRAYAPSATPHVSRRQRRGAATSVPVDRSVDPGGPR